jgi:hypothetical protein
VCSLRPLWPYVCRVKTERSKPAPKGSQVSGLEKRPLRPSSRFAFREYLELLDIPNMFDKVVSCAGKSSLLETTITTGLNFIMPLRPTTVRWNEPPWMNPELSTLITKRQKPLTREILTNLNTWETESTAKGNLSRKILWKQCSTSQTM